MGKRIEGKTKKKSIKANVTSKFSSQRLLSRMGKQVKAGQMGPNTEFVTRSTVLKKLQITLKDFRRLCILKGIYPRVPAKPLKGADKVYYDIKDISYLAHEPLLKKFRDFKSFMKKIRKASGRNQVEEARRKDEMKPVFKIDHLVKERYPRFIDALRDLDDALCMIHLFAAMPSMGRITVQHTATCNALARQWQYYIARSKTLQKVFVSVKGIYYQAVIMGEQITWLAPHKFTQTVPKEVDIRVMMTFLEFYEVFIRFVLFRLYGSVNLKYPPEINQVLDDAGCYLYAVRAKSIDGANEAEENINMRFLKDSQPTPVVQEPIDNLSKAEMECLKAKLKEIESKGLDEEEPSVSGQLTTAFSDLQDEDDRDEEETRVFAGASDDNRAKLFAHLKFFVNREVPLEWLQFCIASFGGLVGWEGPASPFTAEDPLITHQIVDRPMQGTGAQREYIQPQWVFDSINAQFLLPVSKYRPGCVLPPHLSPFVDDGKEGYTPQYKEDLMKMVSGGGSAKSAFEMQDNTDAATDEDEEEADGAPSSKAVSGKRKEELSDDDEDSDDEEESEEVVEVVSKKGPKGIVYEPKQPKQTEDEEAAALSKIMMTKKAKRLYGRMQHGISKKREAVQTLVDKRKALETVEVQPSTKKPKLADKKSKSK